MLFFDGVTDSLFSVVETNAIPSLYAPMLDGYQLGQDVDGFKDVIRGDLRIVEQGVEADPCGGNFRCKVPD